MKPHKRTVIRHTRSTGQAKKASKSRVPKVKEEYTTFNTDRVAVNVFHCLLQDFRAVQGKGFKYGLENILLRSIKDFREYPKPGNISILAPSTFKMEVQVSALLSKYRFEHDVYTDAELEKLTLNNYFEDQKRICTQHPKRYTTFLVLQEARKIVKGILGKYSEEDVISNAHFGKKSSIGCPLALAYIDEKLSNVKAVTGSYRVTKWFRDKILSEDSILRRFLKRVHNDDSLSHINEGDYESLIMKLVPKKWDILRGITPLALLNLFFSFGVGEVVTEKLRNVGLDIRYLQQKHRRLVEIYSRTRSHATADLSAASDSITSELLNALLPREWYIAIKPILHHNLESEDGRSFYTASVLPMGNGATFPLETLVFYSIIKAIGNLTHIHGNFSVYGDDLIYPSRLHRYVREIFPDLGLRLNEDKTFVNSAFRESCGADYFAGVDVRPFYLKGSCQKLTKTRYVAYLYKVYNGLRQRWSEDQIRTTLTWLIREIFNIADRVFRVPPSYPATSGIHVASPGDVPLGLADFLFDPIKCVFAHGSRWYVFSYLLERSKDRFVKYVEPYYWLALQGRNDTVEEERYAFWHEAPSDRERTPELRWQRIHKYRKYFDKARGRMASKKIVSFRASVAAKQFTTFVVKDVTLTSNGTPSSDWV